MSFQGPEINKRQGGLARLGNNTDGVFLFIYAIAADDLPEDLEHNEVHALYQIEDAEALGITASFDANEKVTVHHELSEFFRIATESMIYFMAVAPGTPSAILETAAVQAQIREFSDIKGIGIGGTAADLTAIAGNVESVQAVINAFFLEKRLIDFVIVAARGDDEPLAIGSYPDLRTKNAPNVSVSIAQDPDVAALDEDLANYADVGTILGSLAVRGVNENLGSVDVLNKPRGRKGDQNFTITGAGSWRGASLSDGKAFNSLVATAQMALTDKGYIYAGSFEGYPGIYFNNAPTCVSIQSDYAFIENNRVWNKASRALRNALIPKIRGVLKKNPTTGYLAATSVAAFESIANNAIEPMLVAEEISGYSVYINPQQSPNDQTPLEIKVSIVRDDIVHEIELDLGYSATV